jgi:hypothetical protein
MHFFLKLKIATIHALIEEGKINVYRPKMNTLSLTDTL